MRYALAHGWLQRFCSMCHTYYWLFQHCDSPCIWKQMAKDVKCFWRHLRAGICVLLASHKAWHECSLPFFLPTDIVLTKNCFLSSSRCDLLLVFSMCVFHRRQRWMVARLTPCGDQCWLFRAMGSQRLCWYPPQIYHVVPGNAGM